MLHTVPNPGQSQIDKFTKGKRNRGTNVDMAGRSVQPETWVSWDGRRPDGHHFTNCQRLAAKEVCLDAVSWPTALARGNPPDRWSSILPHSNGCSVLGSAPSSQGPHSISDTSFFGEELKTCPTAAWREGEACVGLY